MNGIGLTSRLDVLFPVDLFYSLADPINTEKSINKKLKGLRCLAKLKMKLEGLWFIN